MRVGKTHILIVWWVKAVALAIILDNLMCFNQNGKGAKPSGELCTDEDIKCHENRTWCGKDGACGEEQKCFVWKNAWKWMATGLKPDLRCVDNDPECQVVEVCRWMRINLQEEREICGSQIVCNMAEYPESYACKFDYQCANGNCNEKQRVCEASAERPGIGEGCEVDFDCKDRLICRDGKCAKGIAPVGRCDPDVEWDQCERYSACMCDEKTGSKCEKKDFRCRPQRCANTEQCMLGDTCIPHLTGSWFTLRPGECVSGLPGCEIVEERIGEKKNSEGYFLPSRRITVRCGKMDLEPGYACANALFSSMGGINCKSQACLPNGTCR